MLVIVHHRTTSLRCLQRVLPACWEKSRESWLRTESVTSLKCLCQKMKSSDRSTAKDCKRMVWIPLKSSDSIHWGRTIEQGRETNKWGNSQVSWQHVTSRSTERQPCKDKPSLSQTTASTIHCWHTLRCWKTWRKAAKKTPHQAMVQLASRKILVLERRLPRKHLKGQVASQCSCHTCRSRYWPPARSRRWRLLLKQKVKPIHEMFWKYFTLYTKFEDELRKQKTKV